MPRVGLNYEQVVRVIRDLENRGEKPTINRVRAELGSGSPNTISQFIKQWRQEQGIPSTEESVGKPAIAKPQAHVADIEVVEVGALTPEKHTPEARKAPSDEPSTEHQTNANPRQGQHKSHQGGRRIFNKRNNHHQNRRQNQHHHNHSSHSAEPAADYEMLSLERLEKMSQADLVKHVKRLESILYKEQVRRESCEKMANEAAHYAEVIKEQVAHRINDLKESTEMTIAQLKLEAQQAREQAEKDLLFYRQQLDKANQRLM